MMGQPEKKLGPFEPSSAWYFSTDGGENYQCKSLTKEEAIKRGRDYDPESSFIVAHCHDHVLRLSWFFIVDDWVDWVNDGPADDYMGKDGDPVFDFPQDAANDLEKMVRASIDAWQEKHGMRFTSHYFGGCWDEEIIAPDDEER